MLLLTPSERAFLEQLEAAKVPVKSIKINPSKTQPLTPALQALLSKHLDMKVTILWPYQCFASHLKQAFDVAAVLPWGRLPAGHKVPFRHCERYP